MEGDSGRPVGNGDDQVDLPDAQGGAAFMLVNIAAEMMAVYFVSGQLFVMRPQEFTKLCTSMAKGIDHAIANNEVPISCRLLPPVLIQVYRARENDAYLLGLMLLTLSVQCACKLEWFTNQDTEALLTVCREVVSNYSDPDLFHIEPRHALACVSYVTSRYYPSIGIDNLLFSVLIQPGCRFCVASIPITTITVSPGRDKISLFVIQVDALRTPACTFTPPTVNIMINGEEIEERPTFSEDESRQLPTDVTDMLKLGVNCLQVFGPFETNLLIALAVASGREPCESELPDNISPSSTDSDQIPEKQPRDLLNSPTLSDDENSTPMEPSSPLYLWQDQQQSFRVPNLNTISIDEEDDLMMAYTDNDDDQDDLGLIPVYVSMQLIAESGLHNIPYNDQDHQEDMDYMMQLSMSDADDDAEDDHQVQPYDSPEYDYMSFP